MRHEMQGTQRQTPSLFRHWYRPTAAGIGDNIAEFLARMNGPCHIEIPGRQPHRSRVLVTLLHGNETSGIKALFALIKAQYQPLVTIHCFIPGIAAALLQPVFTHRQLPGRRDLNRCFQSPFDQDTEGLLCQALLQQISALKAEAVIDMHNTSGDGPAFAVSTALLPRHEPLVSLFTERLVVTDLKLGSLMEADNAALPVITVECGGAHQPQSDQLALEGLQRFFSDTDLRKTPATDWALDIYYHPMRAELLPGTSVSYAEAPDSTTDLTLKIDVERHNFGIVTPETLIGWIHPDCKQLPIVRDAAGNNRFNELYQVQEGMLFPRCQQKLFMITGNAIIARSDCLWYTVTD